eukprot:COSAG02_NODE_962_length_15608_cov_16.347692_6_plen_62_part_00
MGKPMLFLDGARSHKRLLEKAPTSGDTMGTIRLMRLVSNRLTSRRIRRSREPLTLKMRGNG